MVDAILDSLSPSDGPAGEHDLVGLLTVVMGIKSQTRGREPAQNLVGTYGLSAELMSLGLDDLTSIGGIGLTRARRLRAAFRLAEWLTYARGARGDSPSVVTAQLSDLRGMVPTGHTTVLAYRPSVGDPALTLASGVGFVEPSPLGGYLAHMLSDASDEWWVVLLRPGAAPTRIERDVAVRLHHAARVVGVNLTHTFLVSGHRHWVLAAGDGEACAAALEGRVVVESDGRCTGTA